MTHGSTVRTREKCEAAWTSAVRRQQFGAAEISIDISYDQKKVAALIRAWESEGRVRQIAGGKQGHPRAIFEIVPEFEEKPIANIGDAFDQMWTIMRKTCAFGPVDLKAHCSIAVTIEEARSYCRTLLAAGYLRVISKAQIGKKEAVYKLIQATGPRAPRKRRIVCIVDDNRGTVLPLTEDGQ
ncbi:hypothetical protein [Cypionkella psychrotolerans]|uniref:hypothetical protein n=1 Tax=Cypionkella psychrotolerans TaxID=1678131 RepID=UPI0006B4DF1D|nr:hypothetical protein [Cypionkella psychrotolerans]